MSTCINGCIPSLGDLCDSCKSEKIEAQKATIDGLMAENKRLRKCLDNYCWTDEDIEQALEQS